MRYAGTSSHTRTLQRRSGWRRLWLALALIQLLVLPLQSRRPCCESWSVPIAVAAAHHGTGMAHARGSMAHCLLCVGSVWLASRSWSPPVWAWTRTSAHQMVVVAAAPEGDRRRRLRPPLLA